VGKVVPCICVFFGKVFPSGAKVPRVLASDTGSTDGIEDEKDLLAFFFKIPSVERWGELVKNGGGSGRCLHFNFRPDECESTKSAREVGGGTPSGGDDGFRVAIFVVAVGPCGSKLG